MLRLCIWGRLHHGDDRNADDAENEPKPKAKVAATLAVPHGQTEETAHEHDEDQTDDKSGHVPDEFLRDGS